MAHRYQTIGTAALKPEHPSTSQAARIIDFETLQPAPSMPTSRTERMRHALATDPLLGSMGHAFSAKAQCSKKDSLMFAAAVLSVFVLFMGAVLLGA